MKIRELLSIFLKRKMRFTLAFLLFLLIDISAIGLVAVSGWFLTACALAGLSLVGASFNIFAPSGPIRIFALLKPISVYFSNVVNHKMMFNVLTDLRVSFFQKITVINTAKLNTLSFGNTLEKWSKNLIAVAFSFQQVVLPLFGICFLLLFVFSCALLFKSYLLLIVMISQTTIIAGITFLNFGALQKKFKRLSRAQSRARRGVIEFVSQLDILGVYKKTDSYEAYTIRNFGRFNKVEYKKNRTVWVSENILDGILHLLLILWLYIIIIEVSNERFSLPFAVLFFLSQWALLTILSSSFTVIQNYLKIQNTDDALHYKPEAFKEGFSEINRDLPELCTLNLSYQYPETLEKVISKLNVNFKRNAVTVIKGSNGAGKTTLLNILSGSYPVTKDQVFINGKDIHSMVQSEIRDKVAMAAQNPYIFLGSLRENLFLKNNISDEVIIDLLNELNLKKWFLKLEKGLDTKIKTSNVNLSGGQIKRLEFARCILRDTPIMLFDEPTEGLDVVNEMIILNKLRDLALTKTVVLVSHKPVVQNYFSDFITL